MERNYNSLIPTTNVSALNGVVLLLDNATTSPLGPSSGFDYLMIHSLGTFVGTLTLQGSNDNSNWIPLPTMVDLSASSAVPVSTITANGKLYVTPITMRYTRLVCTAYTSGTFTPIVTASFGDVVTFISGNVGINGTIPGYFSPSATAGGFSTLHHLISAASTNATSVKASAGTIGSAIITNTSASMKFFKIFNKASAPVPGTDTPVLVIGVPANSSFEFIQDNGLRLSLGIAYAITGAVADLDATAVAVGDVSVSLNYV